LKRLILGAFIVFLLGVAASAAYNVVYLRRLSQRYSVPGKFYEVNGHRMHLYCTGEGSPTVVLEGGRGDDWLYWQKVQPELAKITRVCTYDRAGLGWSETQPGSRDAIHIAEQLHALLQQSGETGPLIMTGASAGGFYVRQFVTAYPSQVAGVVFVDASVPEQTEALPDAKDSAAKRSVRHRQAMVEWIKETSGWARLSGQCQGEVERGLEDYLALARAEACRPAFSASWLGEWYDFWLSGEQAAQAHCCGDLPLLIVSQDPDRPKPGWSAQSIAANPIWASLQENLKTLSPRSRRIIARNSGHHIMTDRPDVIIRGIGRMVMETRNHADDPGYGTTVVE
jgi:pimeloyl-ACP methyl ester carboxylesterase